MRYTNVPWTKIEPSNIEKVFVIGSGPSTKEVDFMKLKRAGYCIVVNDVSNDFPTADAWFTLDPWGLHKTQLNKDFRGQPFAAVPEAYGTKVAISLDHRVKPTRPFNYLLRVPQNFDITSMRRHAEWGLNEDPRCINSGNSGFGALNLAFHMRPKLIALIGIDATAGYYFNRAKQTRPLNHLPPLFSSAVTQLTRENIQVVDCSLHGKLDCFEKVSWESLI